MSLLLPPKKEEEKKSKPTAWKHWQIYSYRHHAHICQKHKCSSQCIVIEAIIIFFATNGTIRWTCFSELQLQNDQTNLRKLQQKADTAENIHKKLKKKKLYHPKNWESILQVLVHFIPA